MPSRDFTSEDLFSSLMMSVHSSTHGANEDGRPGNELAHLVLALAAERAVERVLRIAAAELAHFRAPTKC
jgi:hypothetical protein